MATIDRQLLLLKTAEACEALLIRPGRLPGEPEPPIAGEQYDREQIFEKLAPALEEAWPGHPQEPEDLAGFLQEVVDRTLETARKLRGEKDCVPAAGFFRLAREEFFEHLRAELEDVQGGVETEDLWRAFDNLEATAPIKQLAQAGLRIKLRALGAFLLSKPQDRYDDEMSASEFFPSGKWEQLRDSEISQAIRRTQGPAHKQIAHVTLTRPLPEEREVYATASYRPQLERIVRLFGQFTEEVDQRLLPEWWPDWFHELSSDTA